MRRMGIPAYISFVLLPALSLLRIYAIARAILWVWLRGHEFRIILQRRQPRSLSDKEAIYRETGGDFFPFGVKDYRLRRYVRGGDTTARRLVRVPLRLALAAWRFPIYVTLCASYMVAVAHWDGSGVPRQLAMLAALAVGIIVTFGTILLAIEIFVASVTVHSFSATVHSLPPSGATGVQNALEDAKIFIGAVLTAHIIDIGNLYLTSAGQGAYAKIQGVPDSLGGVVGKLIDCAYYSLAAFLGSNDPDPTEPLTRVTTGLIGLQSFAFLAVVLGAVIAIVTFREGQVSDSNGPRVSIVAGRDQSNGKLENVLLRKCGIRGLVALLSVFVIALLLRILWPGDHRKRSTGG